MNTTQTIPFSESAWKPGEVRTFQFSLSAQGAAKSAIELENLQESKKGLADYILVTISTDQDNQFVLQPTLLSNLYKEGYRTLEKFDPNTTHHYTLSLTSSSQMPKEYQLQTVSFTMKLGIEAMTQSEPSPQSNLSSTTITLSSPPLSYTPSFTFPLPSPLPTTIPKTTIPSPSSLLILSSPSPTSLPIPQVLGTSTINSPYFILVSILCSSLFTTMFLTLFIHRRTKR